MSSVVSDNFSLISEQTRAGRRVFEGASSFNSHSSGSTRSSGSHHYHHHYGDTIILGSGNTYSSGQRESDNSGRVLAGIIGVVATLGGAVLLGGIWDRFSQVGEMIEDERFYTELSGRASIDDQRISQTINQPILRNEREAYLKQLVVRVTWVAAAVGLFIGALAGSGAVMAISATMGLLGGAADLFMWMTSDAIVRENTRILNRGLDTLA